MNEKELKALFAQVDVAGLITQTKALDTDPDPSPNSGARTLLEYWVHGEGAPKIRWGEHGDFMRCVRHLGKYVTDPKGLCNVYHRAALGVAPGQEKIDEVDMETKRDYSQEQRDEMAQRGQALPDGSFPIKDRADLLNAIHALGRASDPAAAKRHIKKRARSLGLSDLVPTDWKTANGGEPKKKRTYDKAPTTRGKRTYGKDKAPTTRGKDSQDNNSEFNNKHPRNADGTFAYKKDSGGDAGQGTMDAGSDSRSTPDGKVHGRISEAQDLLVKAGLLKKSDGKKGVAVDGYLGPKTVAALKKYQKKNGLKETGKIDTATSKKLGLKHKPSSSSGKKGLDAGNMEPDNTPADTDTKEATMEVQYKAAPVSGIEVVDEGEGRVTAFVSVTGLVDNVKDVIEPGAYEKTLKKRTPKGVWSHDWNSPISKTLGIKELHPGDPELPATLPDGSPWPAEAGALKVDMQFNMKTERGRTAYEDVIFFGPDQEWSIGYNVPAGGATKKAGKRYIKELDLFEYSPVLFGAMPSARTAAQKSMHEVRDAQLEYKSLLESEEVPLEDAQAFNTWFAEAKAYADSLGIETKKAVPKTDDEPDEEADSTDTTGNAVDEDTTVDPEETNETVDDTENEDEEGPDEYQTTATRKKKGISSVTAEKVSAVIVALQDLLDSAAVEAKADVQEAPADVQTSEATTDTVADAVETVGDDLDPDDYNELMSGAEDFDDAYQNEDDETMEEVSEKMLDTIESLLDDEPEEMMHKGLTGIASAIADHLEAITNGETPEEKGDRYVRSENGADYYGLPIGQKVTAAVIDIELKDDEDVETKAKSWGVHGVDWIWEDEKWSDFEKPKAPKTPKKAPPRGTFQHGPRSANSSNPTGRRTPAQKRKDEEAFVAKEKRRKTARMTWNRNAKMGGSTGQRGGGSFKNDTPELIAWKKNFIQKLLDEGFDINEVRNITGYTETAFARYAPGKKSDDIVTETKILTTEQFAALRGDVDGMKGFLDSLSK